MEKRSFTLLQTVGAAGVFSAFSFWYGFMFGRESARKELGNLIEDLRRNNSTENSPHGERKSWISYLVEKSQLNS